MNRRSGHQKLMNEYADVLSSDFYRRTPKAVFAALAVSVITTGGERLDELAYNVGWTTVIRS